MLARSRRKHKGHDLSLQKKPPKWAFVCCSPEALLKGPGGGTNMATQNMSLEALNGHEKAAEVR